MSDRALAKQTALQLVALLISYRHATDTERNCLRDQAQKIYNSIWQQELDFNPCEMKIDDVLWEFGIFLHPEDSLYKRSSSFWSGFRTPIQQVTAKQWFVLSGGHKAECLETTNTFIRYRCPGETSVQLWFADHYSFLVQTELKLIIVGSLNQ